MAELQGYYLGEKSGTSKRAPSGNSRMDGMELLQADAHGRIGRWRLIKQICFSPKLIALKYSLHINVLFHETYVPKTIYHSL